MARFLWILFAESKNIHCDLSILKVTNSLVQASKTLNNFERNSSIRYSSRRAKTLESISSLYVEEDVMRNLEESARIERAYRSVKILGKSHQTWSQIEFFD